MGLVGKGRCQKMMWGRDREGSLSKCICVDQFKCACMCNMSSVLWSVA